MAVFTRDICKCFFVQQMEILNCQFNFTEIFCGDLIDSSISIGSGNLTKCWTYSITPCASLVINEQGDIRRELKENLPHSKQPYE